MQAIGLGYTPDMKIVLFILIGVALLATLGTLFAGLIGIARGASPERSNQLMRWRVVLQGGALLLAVGLMLLMRR